MHSSSAHLDVRPLLLLVLVAGLLEAAAGRLAALCAGALSDFLPPPLTMLIPAASRVTAATAAPAITPTDMPPASFLAGAAGCLMGLGAAGGA